MSKDASSGKDMGVSFALGFGPGGAVVKVQEVNTHLGHRRVLSRVVEYLPPAFFTSFVREVCYQTKSGGELCATDLTEATGVAVIPLRGSYFVFGPLV